MKLWRRSYDTPPAAARPGIRASRPPTPATATCRPDALPATECLADVVRRVVPYWEDAIVPDLLAEGPRGGAVLVVAHGNSIRALRKHIERHLRRRHRRTSRSRPGSPSGTGSTTTPVVESAEYLGDPEAALAAADSRSADQSHL